MKLHRPSFSLLKRFYNTKPPKTGNPYRHPLAYQDPQFYDEKNLEHEMRRVFEICHGCRRCFNLCNSFPKLFELVDQSPSGELDTVSSGSFKQVVDECTLCDLCFLTKCPYVPPHEFNLDFPNLILRYRAVENAKNKKNVESDPKVTVKETTGYTDENVATPVRVEEGVSRELKMEEPSFVSQQVAMTDRNGKIGVAFSKVANFALKNKNMRSVLEKVASIDKEAYIPPYAPSTLLKEVKRRAPPESKRKTDRKVVLYATCLGNYNQPSIGLAARDVLVMNGVDVTVDYTQCCGMPLLERGDISSVAKKAVQISEHLRKYIDQGYTIVSYVPSCVFMIKEEWQLILPHNEDVKLLSQNVKDICEYVCEIAQSEGLVEPTQPVSYEITLHHACHR
jgi:glycerol-3-phosphate dehydrogenase subunit C